MNGSGSAASASLARQPPGSVLMRISRQTRAQGPSFPGTGEFSRLVAPAPHLAAPGRPSRPFGVPGWCPWGALRRGQALGPRFILLPLDVAPHRHPRCPRSMTTRSPCAAPVYLPCASGLPSLPSRLAGFPKRFAAHPHPSSISKGSGVPWRPDFGNGDEQRRMHADGQRRATTEARHRRARLSRRG